MRSHPDGAALTLQTPLERAGLLLDRLVSVGVVRGGVLAVARRDGAVHTLPFGVSDLPGGPVPAAADHRYLLTSITKTFTALQVLALVEEGALTLTTRVAEIVPEFGVAGKEEVEVWHLLTHTSGLDDREANLTEGPPGDLTPPGMLAAANAAPLAHPPGTRVAYCSPSFWVLAEMIRRLSGRDHADDLQVRLAGPLGMGATAYDRGPGPVEGLVQPVVADARHRHLAEQVRMLVYPAGGLISTAGDLVGYGRMLLRGGRSAGGGVVLSAPAVRALAAPWTVGLPGARDYEGSAWRTERGLGWAVGGPGDLHSERTLWHSGGSGTSMWVDLDADLVVVFLTATWFLDRDLLSRVANTVFAALTGDP